MGAKAMLRRVLGRPEQLTTYRDRHRLACLLSVLPLPLPMILTLFGSDKQRPGEHDFGSIYTGVLAQWRYRRLKILGIGVLSGASLLAWRAYFPRAVTIGFDLEDKTDLSAGGRTRCHRVTRAARLTWIGCAGQKVLSI